MKVYEKYRDERFYYPEDMERILRYLNNHGNILVKPTTIEQLYFEFSDNKYCASWMSVNEDILEEFADWLDEFEL